MFRRFVSLAIAMLLVASITPSQALAQTYALEVYTNPNYGGLQCISNAPESTNIHSSCDNQISSLLLKPGWSVRVYSGPNLTGSSVCFNRSDANLNDNTFTDNSPADDTISSFTLYNQSWCGTSPTPAYPLEVYNDVGYGGLQCYSWKSETANVYSGCDNQISSVLLRAGWSLRVYSGPNQTGSVGCLIGSDDNLANNVFFDGTPMNDAISSFKLYSQGDCGNASPHVPVINGPPAGSHHNSTSVTLSWSDAGDPDNWPYPYRNYNAEIRKSDNSWSAISGWQNATTWTPTLPGAGTYIWRVQSGDGLWGSAWSAERTFTVGPVGTPTPQPQPPVVEGDWKVPYYWQGDPRWGSHKIGACNNTIAPVGCALTSLAMVFKFYGAAHDPGTLNSCLGAQACPLYWGHAKIRDCSGGKVTWREWPAFSYARLEQELKKGPVILEINKSGYSHFVVVVKGSGTNPANYIVNDPGVKGGERQTLSRTLALFPGYLPHSLRLYSGTPAYSAATAFTDVPLPLESPSPSANEPVTGAIELYRNTETEMVLELAAQSSAGTVTDMLIWTDKHPSNIWQPFAPYVSVPLDGVYYAQFRDSTGKLSAIVKVSTPSAPWDIQQPMGQLLLPFVTR
jgi:hypothetical protein